MSQLDRTNLDIKFSSPAVARREGSGGCPMAKG